MHIFSEPEPLSQLLSYLALDQLPNCGLIVVNDQILQSHYFPWLPMVQEPIYTITLNGEIFDTENHTYFEQSTIRTTNQPCTTVIICCKSLTTCVDENSRKIFNLLIQHGLLAKTRRAIVYIEDGKLISFAY